MAMRPRRATQGPPYESDVGFHHDLTEFRMSGALRDGEKGRACLPLDRSCREPGDDVPLSHEVEGDRACNPVRMGGRPYRTRPTSNW